jgi:SAM-dependent methyltransferase
VQLRVAGLGSGKPNTRATLALADCRILLRKGICRMMRPMIAQQFGNPRGMLGRLVGHAMARGNADFNRWLVQQLADRGRDEALRIVELGPGPGIGLEEALRIFPTAHVWGVDSSREMLDQSRRHNREQVETGRLTLLQGDTTSLAELAPLDVVFAVHVVYFWRQPAVELARVKGALRSGGALALGYRLRQHMPYFSQSRFPKAGHLLYDSDQEVETLLSEAGFRGVEHRLNDSHPDARTGRLAIGIA